MVSTTSLIIFGIIVVVAIVVIWKWWKKPDSSKKNEDILNTIKNEDTNNDTQLSTITTDNSGPPPPMVFAINDNGFLDLADINGKILNSGFGPNPKVYINLLDLAEKDTTKIETESGVTFTSNVGTTKSHEVAGRPYIINFTRL
jgi:hypothetical protein